ncbi:alkaline phytoceramidase [Cytidiella melzeri]|nr:alkaline phytoceramidase [Cytidiella melzeri]
MTVNTSSTHNVWDTQFWGPVTSTLDWCEANYQFSKYVAELANTFSNLVTIGLAGYGGYLVSKAQLPPRYLTGWLGFALVGLGSFIFHATLRYSAQLMDELPMIYVASYCSAVLFDTQPGHGTDNTQSRIIIALLVAFNVVFTWTYAVYRNPIYHQVVFASIMFLLAFRTHHILSNSNPTAASAKYRIPQQDKRATGTIFLAGALTFAFGFLIWNLDNIYCNNVTEWKHSVGWPAAFVLEGHSWWHVFTALGTYLMLTGNTCATLGIKDDFANYKFIYAWGVLPGITRVAKNGAASRKSLKEQ